MRKEFFEKNKVLLEEIKAKYPSLSEPLNDPILSPFLYPFCFLADRDPTEDEPEVYHDLDGMMLIWINQSTKMVFISVDNMDETLGWRKLPLGLNINTPREWVPVSSPAFNTPYTPSETRDTEVLAIVSLTGGALSESVVNIEIDSVIRATKSVPALTAATKKTFEFTVPAGSTYEFTESGTTSIILVSELTN